jgi:hypothetical protein
VPGNTDAYQDTLQRIAEIAAATEGTFLDEAHRS